MPHLLTLRRKAQSLLTQTRKKLMPMRAPSVCHRSLKMLNKLEISWKALVPVGDEQFPVKVGGIQIQADLACLISSVDKYDNDRVGAILLNTQKVKGLGKKEDTKRKRNKAGEAVALLILSKLQDEFLDAGEPLQSDTIHLYIRASRFWSAPKSYVQKHNNLDAEARAVSKLWAAINPPTEFNPDLATFYS